MYSLGICMIIHLSKTNIESYQNVGLHKVMYINLWSIDYPIKLQRTISPYIYFI